MTPEFSSTFVNYLGDDFKEGRHKASVNAHAARRKHAYRRRDRDIIRSHSDNDASVSTRNRLSPSALPRSHSFSDGSEAEGIVAILADDDNFSSPTSSTELIQMGPPVSLSPYYDFFHLLLPPAFFGINIPVDVLVPDPGLSSETKIRKFGRRGPRTP